MSDRRRRKGTGKRLKSQRPRKSSLTKPGRRPRATRAQTPDIRWSPVVTYFRWQEEFLRVFAETFNARYAAQVANVDIDVVWSACEIHPEFAAKYEQAYEAGLDRLTDIAMERLMRERPELVQP